MLLRGFSLQVPGSDLLPVAGAAGTGKRQETNLFSGPAALRSMRHLGRCSLQRFVTASALRIGVQRSAGPRRRGLEDLCMEPLGLLADSFGHAACFCLPAVAIARDVVVGRRSFHAGLPMEIKGRLRLLEARKLCIAL